MFISISITGGGGGKGPGGGGGLAHLPGGHFVYVSIWLPRGDSKMTPTVHILMIEKVSFNGPPMKSKTRPGFLHIYTFKSLPLISFNYLLCNIY